MADQYPETMELAIDRHALRRYLRTKWFLSWLSLLAFFGGMSGIASASNRLTVEGRLMRRFGLMALEMTTIGGGAQNTIRVIGLKDCERVRDLLADVDRVREQA